jgi:hypothetical protein
MPMSPVSLLSSSQWQAKESARYLSTSKGIVQEPIRNFAVVSFVKEDDLLPSMILLAEKASKSTEHRNCYTSSLTGFHVAPRSSISVPQQAANDTASASSLKNFQSESVWLRLMR